MPPRLLSKACEKKSILAKVKGCFSLLLSLFQMFASKIDGSRSMRD